MQMHFHTDRHNSLQPRVKWWRRCVNRSMGSGFRLFSLHPDASVVPVDQFIYLLFIK